MRARALAIVLGVAALAALGAWLAARRPAEIGTGGDAASPSSQSANASSAAHAAAPVAVADASSRPARLADESAPVVAAPIERPADATLIVRVVEAGTAKPLAGARLTMLREVTLADDAATWLRSERTQAGRSPWVSRGDPVRVDALGDATIPVPSGVRLEVQVDDDQGRDRTRVHARDDDAIAQLAPGETRRVTIEVPPVIAGRVFARVVAEDDGSPVAGARVTGRDGGTLAVSDADGRFALERRTGEPVAARVEADGFSLAIFQSNDGHATPETAVRLELARAVAVEALVVAATDGAPVAGALVKLLAEPFEVSRGAQWVFGEAVEWKATTDANGRCVLAGLPPDVKLRAEVWRDGARVRKEPAPIVVAKGATGRYECRLGSGTRLVGVVLDQHEKAVAGEEIWCVGEDRGRVREAPSEARYFDAIDAPRAAAKTTTDAQGRFAIDDVPAGSIWVGVAARRRGTEGPDPSVSPRAMRVRVESGAREQEIVLRVHRGVFISGRVLRSSGEPASSATVFAIGEGMSSALNAYSNSEGAFALGPLSPGSFQILATAHQGDAESDYVRADAGATDVVLRLKAAGAIRGAVVDTAGASGVETMQRLFRRDGKGPWSAFTAQRAVAVDHDGVLPGVYDLVASTTDGRFAAKRGIVVEAGREVANVELRLEPAARLKIRYEGANPWVDVELRDANGPVERAMVPKGKTVSCVVPPGALRAIFGYRGAVAGERDASAALGADGELLVKDP